MIEISYTQTPEEDGLYRFQDMGFEEYQKLSASHPPHTGEHNNSTVSIEICL